MLIQRSAARCANGRGRGAAYRGIFLPPFKPRGMIGRVVSTQADLSRLVRARPNSGELVLDDFDWDPKKSPDTFAERNFVV